MKTTLGFALEYSLGHITHAENLKQRLREDGDIHPIYVDLPYRGMGAPWARLPLIRSNWSLRASLGAYLGLRRHVATLDAALFHTQVTSLLSGNLQHRVPSVISLDATPVQYDALGAHYGHHGGSGRVEALKKRLNQQAFARAQRLITWSQWAKDSLVIDYGIAADKIEVIPPGVDTDAWDFSRERAARAPGPVNLLFVGGDFVRKGGDTLLAALAQLPPDLSYRLHVVTKSADLGEEAAALGERVCVHRDVVPNSPRLRHLFAQADLFVFPTRADCLPLAVLEALSAGLPVITTAVAALPEAVRHEENGWIVPPDNPTELAEAIGTLASEVERRQVLARQARHSAVARFDACANYRRVLHVLKRSARGAVAV